MKRLIDRTFFWDVDDEWKKSYDWYVVTSNELDEYGRRAKTFEKKTIWGSLQPSSTSLNQQKEGNTETLTYDFYCKDLYQVKIGDYIYKNDWDDDQWLLCDSVTNYNDFGVRNAHFTMVNLNTDKDFQTYLQRL
jgi:hypothetical protein